MSIDIEELERLYHEGYTYKQIAKKMNITISLVQGILSALGLSRTQRAETRKKIWEMRRDNVPIEQIASETNLSIDSVAAKLNGLQKLPKAR